MSSTPFEGQSALLFDVNWEEQCSKCENIFTSTELNYGMSDLGPVCDLCLRREVPVKHRPRQMVWMVLAAIITAVVVVAAWSIQDRDLAITGIAATSYMTALKVQWLVGGLAVNLVGVAAFDYFFNAPVLQSTPLNPHNFLLLTITMVIWLATRKSLSLSSPSPCQGS